MKRRMVLLTVTAVSGMLVVGAAVAAACTPLATFSALQNHGPAGGSVPVEGKFWPYPGQVIIIWEPSAEVIGSAWVEEDNTLGHFEMEVTIPEDAPEGTGYLRAFGFGVGQPHTPGIVFSDLPGHHKYPVGVGSDSFTVTQSDSTGVPLPTDGWEIPRAPDETATDLWQEQAARDVANAVIGPVAGDGVSDHWHGPGAGLLNSILEALPEDAEEVPEEAVPEDVEPSDVVPETVLEELESMLEEGPPEDAVPDDGLPEGDLPEAEVPSEALPEDEVPEGEAPEQDVPEVGAPPDRVPEDDVLTGDAPEGDPPEGESPQEASPEGQTPRGDDDPPSGERTDEPEGSEDEEGSREGPASESLDANNERTAPEDGPAEPDRDGRERSAVPAARLPQPERTDDRAQSGASHAQEAATSDDRRLAGLVSTWRQGALYSGIAAGGERGSSELAAASDLWSGLDSAAAATGLGDGSPAPRGLSDQRLLAVGASVISVGLMMLLGGTLVLMWRRRRALAEVVSPDSGL